MLSIIALGMLIAIGAADGGDYPPGLDYQSGVQTYDQYEQNQYGQSPYGQPGYDSQYGLSSSGQMLGTHDKHDKHDKYNHHDYDWLSPGPIYWQYSYPVYYNYWWYNDDYWWYNHYPKYYYTAPVTYYTWYPAYSWGPWYGIGSTTYYYSSSWSYHNGGYFFDP